MALILGRIQANCIKRFNYWFKLTDMFHFSNLMLTRKELEQRIHAGPKFLAVAFIRTDSEITEEYCEKIVTFFNSLPLKDLEIILIDADEETELSLSHRVSIAPTLIVFESGSRCLTRISEIDFDELREFFMVR